MDIQRDKSKKSSKKPANNLIRFSGIAFQMGGIIAAGSYFGVWLDGKFSDDFPLFTLIFSLFSVFAAIYLAVKDVLKINK